VKQIDRKLVYIKWIDSYGCGSAWEEVPQDDPLPHHCYSVGWIIGESDHVIMIAPHISPQDKKINSVEMFCGDMTIPKVSICQQVELDISGKT